MERCKKPVICAIHSACVGGGVDLVTATDIRLATQDAWFCVKEVDMGLAADVGTLQRLPKVNTIDSQAQSQTQSRANWDWSFLSFSYSFKERRQIHQSLHTLGLIDLIEPR